MEGEERIRRYQRKYAELFGPGQSVLDIGCGTGLFLEQVREIGATPTGVDSFEPSVEACASKGLNVVLDDVFHFMDTSDDTFDGVMCSHVIEHFTPDKAFDLMRSARRILKPNGRLIVITPNYANIRVMSENFWLDVTHVRPYPLPLLRYMLEELGYSIQSSGHDRHTGEPGISLKHPRGSLRYIVSKIRWGRYYGTGDSFVIAANTTATS